MEIESYIGNADEFPILQNWKFLNHAAVAPLCRRAASAMAKFAQQASQHAYIGADWYTQIEQLRVSAAELISADKEEIAFVKNTSEGLALVANGLDWRDGDRIVSTNVEYPANAYPWIDLIGRKGIDLVRVEEVEDAGGARRVPLEAILQAAEHPRTRLVTLSHVEFGSGQRHDLVAIGRFCVERDILLCVDGIQSLGVLPVNVREMNIAFLSADGHKWMLGPEGAGIFYCRKDLIAKMHPAIVGWLNVQRPFDFDNLDYTLKSNAGRFEYGSPNVAGLLALKASIDMISSIGIEAIWRQVDSLNELLVQGLTSQGFLVSSPRLPTERSGIVSFGRADLNTASTAKRLKEKHGIELAVRSGRLRTSPHFYTPVADIEHLLSSLSGRNGE